MATINLAENVQISLSCNGKDLGKFKIKLLAFDLAFVCNDSTKAEFWIPANGWDYKLGESGKVVNGDWEGLLHKGGMRMIKFIVNKYLECKTEQKKLQLESGYNFAAGELLKASVIGPKEFKSTVERLNNYTQSARDFKTYTSFDEGIEVAVDHFRSVAAAADSGDEV